MPSYTFTKLIEKINALQGYLASEISYEHSFHYTNGVLVIYTVIELDTDQLSQLQTVITNYTDPFEHLLLNYIETDSSASDNCNSIDYTVVKQFIHPYNTNNGFFDNYKMIINYKCDSTVHFADVTNASVSLSVFCETRNTHLTEMVIDISDIISDWKTKSGPQYISKTISINGLRQYNIDHDTIRSFKLKVTDSNINVRLHTLQSMFYNIE
jgi:hypothetical protein